MRFFPPHQRNYEAYAQARCETWHFQWPEALLQQAQNRGGRPGKDVSGGFGRFQRSLLQRSPFSKVLLVQLPDSPEGLRTRQQLELWQAQMQNWQMQCQQAQNQMPQRCRAQMQPQQVEPQTLPPCT